MSTIQPTDGHDCMASLAAQLMGRQARGGVQAPAVPSPARHAASPTIPRTVPAPQPSAAALQTSLPGSEGPSLYGNAEQLKEARAFLSSATAGAIKSRGGSRQRSLPREPTYRPTTRAASASTSSRGTVAQDPHRVAAAAKPVVPSAKAPGGFSQWQSLRAQQSNGTESQVLASSSSSTKAGLSHFQKQEQGQAIQIAKTAGQSSGSDLKISNAGELSPRLSENTNTLKNGTSHPLPPHLRTKGAPMPNSVQAEPAETTAPIMQDIPGRDRTISVPVDTLLELKKGLSALNERVTDLESENFTIQKQLEALLQAEERRKYLGTDSSLVPYGIDVQRSSGAATRVQVNSSLRIGDLIRRIRTKCDVSPSESKNPRVEFHGQQVGHGMTLSEAGITADAVVHFSHSE